jgi:hypothetical protein
MAHDLEICIYCMYICKSGVQMSRHVSSHMGKELAYADKDYAFLCKLE